MNMLETPLVHVVDDDLSVQRALTRLLRLSGHESAAYTSAEEFLARLDRARPGCAIVDLRLPGADGLELQERLREERDALPLIFLTGAADVAIGVRAMKAGAVDFLIKPFVPDALIAVVAQALERDRLDRGQRVQQQGFDTALASLTRREKQVLDLVIAGMLNKQIAAELGTAEKTVKVHRARIMHKMNARTATDLVRVVVSHQLN